MSDELPTPERMEQAWHVIDDLTGYLINRPDFGGFTEHWGMLVEAKRRLAMTMDMFASEDMPGYHEAWRRVLALDDE